MGKGCGHAAWDWQLCAPREAWGPAASRILELEAVQVRLPLVEIGKALMHQILSDARAVLSMATVALKQSCKVE